MTPWLAFIESNTSGTGRLFARAAVEQGLRPVLLTDNSNRYQYAIEDGIDVIEIDTRDESALMEECRRLAAAGELVGVTSSSEYFVVTAASLARQLDLPGPSPAALRRCRDKHKQRVRLRDEGVAVPAFHAASTVKSAEKAAREIGFPVVVKTVSGSGSVGVKLCADADEVASYAATLLAQRHNERGMPVPQRILVEEVADGPEYSVETFGKTVIGITQKHLGTLPFFVEVGHDFPAPLSPELSESIQQISIRALEALGLGWGPAHLELRVTSRGIRIIEVNPRLAGGFIPRMVQLSCGVDLIAQTIRLVSGQFPSLEKPFARHASIRFLIPPGDGVFIAAEGVDEAKKLPDVVEVNIYVQPESKVQRRGDFRDRIGHVIACGATAQSARCAAEKAHAAVRLLVNPN
jgi:biotin carboxylase